MPRSKITVYRHSKPAANVSVSIEFTGIFPSLTKINCLLNYIDRGF